MDGLDLKWGVMIGFAALASCSGTPNVGASASTGGTGDASSTGLASTGVAPTTMAPDSSTSTGTSTSTGPDAAPTSTSTGPDADTGTSSSSGNATDGSSSSGGSDDTNPGALPNGSECTENTDCFSNNCFLTQALGGVCGECDTDHDCDFGCTPANPLDATPSACNAGQVGEGCKTTAACAGELQCTQIFSVPTVLDRSTCSECDVDGDCAAGETCQPNYDVANLTGSEACVDVNSRPDGAGCDLDNPNVACINECAPGDLSGLITLGVCGQCIDDNDCRVGQTCTGATVDLDVGLVASVCE